MDSQNQERCAFDMRKRIRARKGSISIVLIGISFAIIVFAMFFLELHTMWNYQYSIVACAQRAVNSTVEYAMDDKYRSDGYNFMDVSKAQSLLYINLRDDLLLNTDSPSGGTHFSNGKKVYSISYDTPQYYDGKGAEGAGIVIKLHVTMYSKMSSAFGASGIFSWDSIISSTNFRTDDDLRAGSRAILTGH